MIRQIIPYLVLFSFFVVTSSAQEVVTGLKSNYQITKSEDKHYTSAKKGTDTLELPFFDDFSGSSVFPETDKWSDYNVFINNTYSEDQITKGIATFDGLDSLGRLYETASSAGFEADILTSNAVNLNYSPSENIWFSFFYQPGGLSDPPEVKDSLTLQFYAPEEDAWYAIWKAEGDSVQDFKPVIINIDQTRFLKKGFRFRFINYASLNPDLSDPSMVGNCDIWNIDYVFLDKDRNKGDTIFADVAFRLPLRSLIADYESMPWKHFKQIELQAMDPSIPIHYRNNDTIARNVTRNFEIWNVYENYQSHFFTAGASNIAPLSNVDSEAELIYTFNTANSDSALFRVTCSLKTDEFDPKENDTLVYYQIFKDYFAVDDGSSEAGYGINGLGSRNAMVAYRFQSYIQDTLRAISICFNDSYQDANARSFDLMVWDDNKGVPGNILFTKEEVMVNQGEAINGFYTYTVPGDVMVNSVFYIGWKQRSETFLNAGLDVNTPHAGKQFYWLNGEWKQSQITSSLMIRPIVGAPLKTTAINDVTYKNRRLISVWPNPASDEIRIDPGTLYNTESAYIIIIDLNGREVIKVPYIEQIDISSLHEGIYILTISMNGIPVGYNRFIKTR